MIPIWLDQSVLRGRKLPRRFVHQIGSRLGWRVKSSSIRNNESRCTRPWRSKAIANWFALALIHPNLAQIYARIWISRWRWLSRNASDKRVALWTFRHSDCNRFSNSCLKCFPDHPGAFTSMYALWWRNQGSSRVSHDFKLLWWNYSLPKSSPARTYSRWILCLHS